MAATPPPLMEELEEEILLRFPPNEPSLHVHAALVCKRWRHLVSYPGFRRSFRELHRTPPMLGFLCNVAEDVGLARFMPTAAFCSPRADRRRCCALDARHGHVLLQCSGRLEDFLVVWDPITDEHLELPIPPWYMFSWTAAVLCAACGPCDHLDCHRGSFLVVFVGSDSGETFVCTYSSDVGTWSEPTATMQAEHYVNSTSVLVGNALYFGVLIGKIALKYDLESQEISVSGMPPTYSFCQRAVLTTTEEGGLGLATVHESKLHLWWKAGPEVDAGWTQNRVIELEMLLPGNAISTSHVIGFTEGIGVIFLKANDVLFTIDLKTSKVKKVCKGTDIYSVVPYMNFYTPALGAACTDEGSSVFASGATTEN